MRRDQRRRPRQLPERTAGSQHQGRRSSPTAPQRGPRPAALGFGGGLFHLCGLHLPPSSTGRRRSRRRRRQPAPAGDRVLHVMRVRWCSPVLPVRADSRWRGRGSHRSISHARSGCSPCLASWGHGDLFSGHHADCRRAHPRRRRRWWRRHRSRWRGADPGSRGAPTAPQQDGFGRCGRTGLPDGHSRLRRLLLVALMKKSIWKKCWVATIKIRGNILPLPSRRRFLLHFEILNICNNIQMNVVLNTVVLVICDCRVRADTSNLCVANNDRNLSVLLPPFIIKYGNVCGG